MINRIKYLFDKEARRFILITMSGKPRKPMYLPRPGSARYLYRNSKGALEAFTGFFTKGPDAAMAWRDREEMWLRREGIYDHLVLRVTSEGYKETTIPDSAILEPAK